RTEDTGSAGVGAVTSEDDGGVLIKADVGAVEAAGLFPGTDDDAGHHFALLDVAAGDGVLDSGDEPVADSCIAASRSAQHADDKDLLGTGVIGNLQPRFLLNHLVSPIVLRDSQTPPPTSPSTRSVPALNGLRPVGLAGSHLLVSLAELVDE